MKPPSYTIPPTDIMPSLLSHLIARQDASTSDVAAELRTQWSAPPDVLSILLLLGGDVVQASLAQLTSSPIPIIPPPTVFSFGWVAYSVSALLSAVGDNHLMPQSPDYPCLVVNGKSGYARANRSWIISRTLRDFDFWKDEKVKVEEKKLLEVLKQKLVAKGLPNVEPRVPLSASIYNVSAKQHAGTSTPDFIYAISFLVILVQLGIAAIPCALYGDWAILMVTGAGTALAWATAALPQWREEKVGACRKESTKTFVITSGNGTKDVIVIRGGGVGLDLEDLAAANARTSIHTRIALCVFAILWIALLITVAGLKQNTWFLLGVGGIGTLQNILVAALPRKPSAYGLHLEYERTIAKEKVMSTLMALEEEQAGLGRSLLAIFFPGEMREDEIEWWANAKVKAKAGARVQNPTPATPAPLI
jgi:hypothetical protein